tara:strand:- start:215 stop:601 length:387 start_codon:yes stop_codon:yes gene_type:complete
MVKHKRWSDKQKTDTSSIDEEKNSVDQEISVQKEPKNIKSIILSGTKYAYIIGISALLCGIFTPITIGVEIEDVILGMLTIFLGLGGGVAIFLGIKKQKFITQMILIGLGMMSVSLILIFELSERSLF